LWGRGRKKGWGKSGPTIEVPGRDPKRGKGKNEKGGGGTKNGTVAPYREGGPKRGKKKGKTVCSYLIGRRGTPEGKVLFWRGEKKKDGKGGGGRAIPRAWFLWVGKKTKKGEKKKADGATFLFVRRQKKKKEGKKRKGGSMVLFPRLTRQRKRTKGEKRGKKKEEKKRRELSSTLDDRQRIKKEKKGKKRQRGKEKGRAAMKTSLHCRKGKKKKH